MEYVFTGFTHTAGFRVFAFESVTDKIRSFYSVSADMALARKHGIRVQELPLLCRALLTQRTESDDQRAFTFTDGDMTSHKDLVRAAVEANKKAPRRPPVSPQRQNSFAASSLSAF
jgi:hypothetical protein